MISYEFLNDYESAAECGEQIWDDPQAKGVVKTQNS